MSRAQASPAGRAGLLDAFVDDAAVFPPGLAGWQEAVLAHVAYRHSSWGRSVGPLLVPPDGVDGLLAELDGATGLPVPLAVAVVSRDGPGPAAAATAALLAGGRVRVVAVELPLGTAGADLARTWAELSGPPRPPARVRPEPDHPAADGAAVWWELDRAGAVDGQLDAIASARRGLPGGAKLRTGGTTPDAVAPTPLLAGFLVGCAARGLPFKLTAGLHHAVRGPDPVTGGVTHGVLDVVLATRAAARGADEAEVARVLDRTDAPGLAREVRDLGPEDVREVRRLWASFGCCGVLDPLGELAAAGVR